MAECNQGHCSGPRCRGLAILETEISIMTTALKRSNVWSRSDAVSAHPTLLKPFVGFRAELTAEIKHLEELNPNVFLAPFLEVIRSDVVTGHVTGLALNSIQKLLSYELLHVDMKDIANAVENIADSVTRARFVGVDPKSDEVVLMKILAVLRTLMLSSVGLLLTNEGVCEILQSTFRICFETRLSDLLRKTAELALNDMIQLLFKRLPTFSEENLPLLKKLKMRNTGGGSHGEGKSRRRKHEEGSSGGGGDAGRKSRNRSKNIKDHSPAAASVQSTQKSNKNQSTLEEKCQESTAGTTILNSSSASIDPVSPGFNVDTDVLARSPTGSVTDLSQIQSDTESEQPLSMKDASDETDNAVTDANIEKTVIAHEESSEEKRNVQVTITSPKGTEYATAVNNKDSSDLKDTKITAEKVEEDDAKKEVLPEKEFINSQGITFTPTAEMVDDSGSLIPYGLPCVRELFRFLISLIGPDGIASVVNGGSAPTTSVGGITFQNDSMIQVALALLATALETGVDHLDKYESLLDLVKDDLTKNLVALLSSERVATFSATLWISYLVFSSQRKHLKYQLEIFLVKLMDVVNTENNLKITYEHRELILDMIVRLYKMQDFITELYVNYDCDLYTHNIFEDLTKMLSKNAFPVTGLYSTQFLSLDALLTVVESIERECQHKVNKDANNGKDSDTKEEVVPILEEAEEQQQSSGISSREQLLKLKQDKKLITTVTELFNTKPSKAIDHMEKEGLIATPLDPEELAQFLRGNPHLDKAQLGEFISKKGKEDILKAFVDSFDFRGLRIDESLRIFLETFRLPGEAPVIGRILDQFSDTWRTSNSNALADNDAAYMLAYAVIMLNVDQHNKNHTRINDPMTAEQFKRNLRGTNCKTGDPPQDHDQEMLDEIYHAIRSEEIVMPAEQTGLVKENYLWKCALKRGMEQEGRKGQLLRPKVMFDRDLFSIIWGPAVAALSYVFDKSRINKDGAEMIERSLNGFQRCAAIAAHYRMNEVLDNIVISLCKFTTLTNSREIPYLFVPQFGGNLKALMATKTIFILAHRHGDILHDGWKNVLECLLWLFKCQLLPNPLMEVEDFVDNTGRVKLLQDDAAANVAKVESGFLNSFVSWMSGPEAGGSSYQRPRTPEEEESAEKAVQCIKECQTELLITESKFLQVDSLRQLVRHIISCSNLDQLSRQVNQSIKENQSSSSTDHNNSRTTSPPINNTLELSDAGDDDTAKIDEAMVAFYLELLVRITIQNKSRVQDIWSLIMDHIKQLVNVASDQILHVMEENNNNAFLLERTVNGLLRMVVRLAKKEDFPSTVVQQSLSILLDLNKIPQALSYVARHVSFGLHELLLNNAANIHKSEDWSIIFSLMEIIGAGVDNTKTEPTTKDSAEDDPGNEVAVSSTESGSRNASPGSVPVRERSGSIGSSSGGWIVLDKATTGVGFDPMINLQSPKDLINYDHLVQGGKQIVIHDSLAFLKCCESLAFLIRDVAHITPHNFKQCVLTLRVFVEASFSGRVVMKPLTAESATGGSSSNTIDNHNKPALEKNISKSAMKRTPFKTSGGPPSAIRKVRSAPHKNITNVSTPTGSDYEGGDADSDNDDLSSEFHHLALQLLDLLHTLHIRAAEIHKSWEAEEDLEKDDQEEQEAEPQQHQVVDPGCISKLWSLAWCPLLQGMALLCCDRRSHIRTSALTTLQRALLFHDLQALSCLEWEAAFSHVLFPTMNQLLIPSQPGERNAMEEIRTRAATFLGKVFLQHLTPLTTLPTFTALWLTILDFMERFIKAASSDLLADAVPESLKNMLLVMETAGIFQEDENSITPNTNLLWDLTKEKLNVFLPNLMSDLFLDRQSRPPPPNPPKEEPKQDHQLKDAASENQPMTSPSEVEPAKQEKEDTNTATITQETPKVDQDVGADNKTEAEILPPESNKTEEEMELPHSPMDPPVLPATFFYTEDKAPVPISISSIVIPPPPKIEPMPPPPPGIEPLVLNRQNFQPIQTAPVCGTVPLVNPKPVMPTIPHSSTLANSPLSNYFSMSTTLPSSGGNILTAAFTPTLGSPSNTVFMGSGQGEDQGKQEEAKK